MLSRITYQLCRSFCFLLIAVALSSSVLAEDRVRFASTPDGGHPVAAEVDGRGTLHLLWNSPSGPRYARSTDDGNSFHKSVDVVDSGSKKPGLEFTAWDMATDSSGRVHVALSTNAWKLKLPKEEWAFFYARLEPDSDAFSPIQNINHQPSEGFSLAADGRGNVTACWLSGKLYASVSRDHGQTFGPAVEIDPSWNPCDCCTSSITYGKDGRLAVLYREETNNDRDMFLILWDQERNTKTRSKVSTTPWKIDACPMSYYSIEATEDGYLLVWPTKGQIFAARTDSKGTLRSPAEITTRGKSGMRTGMTGLTAPDGYFLVTWKKDERTGWQLFDQEGNPVGAAAYESSPGNGTAAALTKSGRFVIIR